MIIKSISTNQLANLKPVIKKELQNPSGRLIDFAVDRNLLIEVPVMMVEGTSFQNLNYALQLFQNPPLISQVSFGVSVYEPSSLESYNGANEGFELYTKLAIALAEELTSGSGCIKTDSLKQILSDITNAQSLYKIAYGIEQTGEYVSITDVVGKKKAHEAAFYFLNSAIERLNIFFGDAKLSDDNLKLLQFSQSLLVAREILKVKEGEEFVHRGAFESQITPVNLIGKGILGTEMSSYVASLPLYNACQLVHWGRLDFQIKAGEIIKEHFKGEPVLIFDPGCSNGLFSTHGFRKVAPEGSVVVSVEPDVKAVEEHRVNFLRDPNVIMLNPFGLQDFARDLAPSLKPKVVIMAGMYTDIGKTKKDRLPTLKDLVNALPKGGLVLLDEEIIDKHNNESERIAALWKHHGSTIIFESILQYNHYRHLAGGNIDFKRPFPNIEIEKFRKAVVDDTDPVFLAMAHHHLAVNAELEAFVSGVKDLGDHKSILFDMVEELQEAGLGKISYERICPREDDLVVDQDTLKIVLGLEKDSLPQENLRWDRVSAEVIRIINSITKEEQEKIRSSGGDHALQHNEKFKRASNILKQFADDLYKEVGNPLENLDKLLKIGIKMIKVGNATHGVFLFRGEKLTDS